MILQRSALYSWSSRICEPKKIIFAILFELIFYTTAQLYINVNSSNWFTLLYYLLVSKKVHLEHQRQNNFFGCTDALITYFIFTNNIYFISTMAFIFLDWRFMSKKELEWKKNKTWVDNFGQIFGRKTVYLAGPT